MWEERKWKMGGVSTSLDENEGIVERSHKQHISSVRLIKYCPHNIKCYLLPCWVTLLTAFVASCSMLDGFDRISVVVLRRRRELDTAAKIYSNKHDSSEVKISVGKS